MTLFAIESPYPLFKDLDGSPLDGGYLFFGAENQNPETSTITVYWDAAGTQPAAQPIRTLNGFIVRGGTPAQLYVNVAYSLSVRNRRGKFVYGAPSSIAYSQASATGATVTAFIASLAAPSGSTLVGTIQTGLGAVARTQKAKNNDWIDFADFGVIYDGNPAATTIGATGTDNIANVRKAIKAAALTGKRLRLTGIARISDEFEILAPGMVIEGDGPGTGFGDQPLLSYTMRSGFLVTGGTQRVRTRRKYRASAADPQDDPLSVAVNVQAEGVTLRDFCVYLWFNRTDFSPTNYGAACDVGVFNGCRVNLHLENVHVVGYYRGKAVHQDVTRATNLPEFNDLDGNPYPRGTVTNGADGLILRNCFISGGKSGLSLWGASTPTNVYAGAYYDQILGAAVADQRGTFGCSDVTVDSCEIFATEHHSLYRRNDPTMAYTTDTCGAAVEIDGLAGNGSGCIQGMRFISGRIATWEAFKLRLGNCNRVILLGTHIEQRSGSGALTTAGVPVAFTTADTYGVVTMQAKTTNALLQGLPGSLAGSGFDIFIDAAATYHELFSGSSSPTSSTFHTIVAAGFVAPVYRVLVGDLDLRAATTADSARIRLGNTTKLTVSPTAVTLTDGSLRVGSAGPSLVSGTGGPNGVMTAPPGSIYMNNSGGALVSMYVKESGTGNTGWVAK